MTISLGMLLKSCKSFNHLWHHPDELEDDLSLSSCLWNSFSNSNYRHGRIIPGLVWQGSSSITVFLTDDQLQYSSNVVIAVWYNSPNDGSYCIGTDLGSEDKWYKQLQLILQLQPGIFIPDDGGYCLNVITTDTGLRCGNTWWGGKYHWRWCSRGWYCRNVTRNCKLRSILVISVII